MPDEVTLSAAAAGELAVKACLNVGASQASARSLADATISAMLYGPSMLGFPHLVDYLNSFREGRIKGDPTPVLGNAYPAFLVSDADQGIAQLGFDRAFDKLVKAARTHGIAIFTQTNSYTVGELGYYVRRLADEHIIALASSNANAMVTPQPGGPAVYGTNPLAFGFPLGDGSPPLLIDQASSATAYINLVRAAAEKQPIPEGWAVDENGMATSDPVKALAGALLPFGGRKGGNVALLVEMLSAGLSGGPWSLDTADFTSGSASPAVGLTIIAIMPGSDDRHLAERAQKQADRLIDLGIFVPGVSGTRACADALKIPRDVFETVQRFAQG